MNLCNRKFSAQQKLHRTLLVPLLTRIQRPLGSSSRPAVVVAASFASLSLGAKITGSGTKTTHCRAPFGPRSAFGLLFRTWIVSLNAPFNIPEILAKRSWISPRA